MGQGSSESIQAVTDSSSYAEGLMQGAQLRLLDYLNISLCECEKPANFTIFVARLRNEIENGKLI